MFCTVFIFSKIQEELKMKKVIAIVLAVMMLCAVTACGGGESAILGRGGNCLKKSGRTGVLLVLHNT